MCVGQCETFKLLVRMLDQSRACVPVKFLCTILYRTVASPGKIYHPDTQNRHKDRKPERKNLLSLHII